MNRNLGPIAAAAGAGAFTIAVVARMQREYRDCDTFTPKTVALLYSAYAANGLALTWSAREHTWPIPIPAHPARASGIALIATGSVATVAAMTRFGSGAQISGIEPGALQTDGLYQYSRNPQYAGLVATLAGITVASRSGLAATITTGAIAVLNRWIRTEEAHLTRVFGDTYQAYQSRTRRWI